MSGEDTFLYPKFSLKKSREQFVVFAAFFAAYMGELTDDKTVRRWYETCKVPHNVTNDSLSFVYGECARLHRITRLCDAWDNFLAHFPNSTLIRSDIYEAIEMHCPELMKGSFHHADVLLKFHNEELEKNKPI